MYVVASLLNPAATRHTQELWLWLEEHCGLAGIKLTPLPHFSWLTAEEYNLAKMEDVLQKIASNTTPFLLTTSGLGIFTGTKPVLYTPLVKTRQLMELHETIRREGEPLAVNLNRYYEPETWIPHITLAYRDVNPDNLACAIQDLAFRPLILDVLVDHLALIYEVDGQIGIKFRYNFKKQ